MAAPKYRHGGTNMKEQMKVSGKKKIPRSRRKRLFGMTDAILSKMTVYLNPYVESQDGLSLDEAALYDVANRIFTKRES